MCVLNELRPIKLSITMENFLYLGMKSTRQSRYDRKNAILLCFFIEIYGWIAENQLYSDRRAEFWLVAHIVFADIWREPQNFGIKWFLNVIFWPDRARPSQKRII